MEPGEIEIAGVWSWEKLFARGAAEEIGRAIAANIGSRRWFGAKANAIGSATLLDSYAVTPDVRVVLANIEFAGGESEVYQIPLGFATGEKCDRLLDDGSVFVWARLRLGPATSRAILYDAAADADFCQALLALFDDRQTLAATDGEVVVERAATYDAVRGGTQVLLPAEVGQAEQSNTSIRYGDRLMLKLFRRIETGVNPDWEVNQFLARQRFAHVPPLGGAIEYRSGGRGSWSLALLQAFVANQGDAWKHTLERLEAILSRDSDLSANLFGPARANDARLCQLANQPVPTEIEAEFGASLSDARRLGERTGQLHQALSSDASDPAFQPVPWTQRDEQASLDRCRQFTERTFDLLRRQIDRMEPAVADSAQQTLRVEANVKGAFASSVGPPDGLMRIRIHGDYHLGQVLVADNDFVIIDFEGEPSRPLIQRRERQLALRDVAGMIRSFHYASSAAVAKRKTDAINHRDANVCHAWFRWTSAAFLSAYRNEIEGACFVPHVEEEFERLLNLCLLEKAVYELRYELNHRPDWVELPLHAIRRLASENL